MRKIITIILAAVWVTGCGGDTSAPAPVTVSKPIPASIRIISGNFQTVEAGSSVPAHIAVDVRDSTNNPIPDVVVRFFPSAGATSTSSVVTNSFGQASVDWTVGTLAGQELLQIRTGDPGIEPSAAPPGSGIVVIYATAVIVPAAAARLEMVHGDGQIAPIGGPVAVAPSVRAFDRYGNAVAEPTIQFTPSNGSTIGTQSASGGVVSIPWTLGGSPGTDSLVASLPGVSGSRVVFTATALGILAAKDVAFLQSGACALDLDGAPWCWKGGVYGVTVINPARTPTSLRFESLAAGNSFSHTCALSHQAGYCWGTDTRGELGDGGGTTRTNPVAVAGNLLFSQLVVGEGFTCGLDLSGAAFCWGANDNGQLGDSTRNQRNTPGAVRTPIRFVKLAAGSNHVCGLVKNGDVYCWGNSIAGQAGAAPGLQELCANQRYDCVLLPIKVSGGPAFNDIIAKGWYTCGLASVNWYCWGDLSLMGFGKPLTPAPISTATMPASLVAGAGHLCGLMTDGSARCVGANAFGELGRGDFKQSTVEAPVLGGHQFTGLFAGDYATCGVTIDGSLYCWGMGPTGDGSAQDRSIPGGVVKASP